MIRFAAGLSCCLVLFPLNVRGQDIDGFETIQKTSDVQSARIVIVTDDHSNDIEHFSSVTTVIHRLGSPGDIVLIEGWMSGDIVDPQSLHPDHPLQGLLRKFKVRGWDCYGIHVYCNALESKSINLLLSQDLTENLAGVAAREAEIFISLVLRNRLMLREAIKSLDESQRVFLVAGSAHAFSPELLQFLKNFPIPSLVVAKHGEREASEAMRAKIIAGNEQIMNEYSVSTGRSRQAVLYYIESFRERQLTQMYQTMGIEPIPALCEDSLDQ